MLKFFRSVVAISAVVLATGCVSDHSGSVELEAVDFSTKKPVKKCFLLTIQRKPMSAEGTWWKFEQTVYGPMVTCFADLCSVSPGYVIHQSGGVTPFWSSWGTQSGRKTWEYWVFAKGYRPEHFYDDNLMFAYENKQKIKPTLSAARYGKNFSDEDILDGARKFLDCGSMLETTKESGSLNQLLYAQVSRVFSSSKDPKMQEIALDLKKRLRKIYLSKFAKALPADQRTALYLETVDPGVILTPEADDKKRDEIIPHKNKSNTTGNDSSKKNGSNDTGDKNPGVNQGDKTGSQKSAPEEVELDD